MLPPFRLLLLALFPLSIGNGNRLSISSLRITPSFDRTGSLIASTLDDVSLNCLDTLFFEMLLPLLLLSRDIFDLELLLLLELLALLALLELIVYSSSPPSPSELDLRTRRIFFDFFFSFFSSVSLRLVSLVRVEASTLDGFRILLELRGLLELSPLFFRLILFDRELLVLLRLETLRVSSSRLLLRLGASGALSFFLDLRNTEEDLDRDREILLPPFSFVLSRPREVVAETFAAIMAESPRSSSLS